MPPSLMLSGKLRMGGVQKTMRIEQVEIYSDATNAAMMRHPGRQFPGLVIQGDTLNGLCQQMDQVCKLIGRGSEAHEEANEVRNHLWALRNHYVGVLDAHGIKLPFAG
jgi:hypothetical protein